MKGSNMANMEREELLRQYHAAAEFIEETEFTAQVLEENPAMPVPSLIIGIPEEMEEGRYMVCNMIPLEEDDSAYTNLMNIFYEIPYEVTEIDELTLMQAINAMNAVMAVGHFIYNRMSEEKARVQYRLVITSDVEEPLNPSTICDCACFVLRYALVMEEIVTGLLAGMDLPQILEAEGLWEG